MPWGVGAGAYISLLDKMQIDSFFLSTFFSCSMIRVLRKDYYDVSYSVCKTNKSAQIVCKCRVFISFIRRIGSAEEEEDEEEKEETKNKKKD